MAGRISIISIIGSEPGGRPDTMGFHARANGSLNESPVKTAQNKDYRKQAEAKPGANAVERRTSKEDRKKIELRTLGESRLGESRLGDSR